MSRRFPRGLGVWSMATDAHRNIRPAHRSHGRRGCQAREELHVGVNGNHSIGSHRAWGGIRDARPRARGPILARRWPSNPEG